MPNATDAPSAGEVSGVVRKTARSSDGLALDVRLLDTDAHATSNPLPVVLVHGWMVSGAVWNTCLSDLTQSSTANAGARPRRWVVPDQRGAGRSGRPPSAPHAYSLESYGRDVLALTSELGLEQFVLVGHSMGGQIAQWVAANAPGRVLGLCLVAPVPLDGLPFPAEARELFSTSAGDRAKQATILGMACKALPDEERSRLLDDAATVDAGCIRSAFETFVRGDATARFDAIRCKALVVSTDDPFLPPDFLDASIVRRIAGAELARLPGAGHYPQVEKPRETATLIRRFVESLSA